MRRNEHIRFPVGVAYVLPGLGRGGTEKHVMELASRIDRRRFSPCVISTAGGGAMEDELSSRGIPVYALQYRGLSLHPSRALPLFRDARGFFRSFAHILAENGISVLHAYLPAANVLGMAAAVLNRTRVRIVSKRALCRYKVGHPAYSLFEDLANLAADAIMVNSLAVAEDVRRNERWVDGRMFLVYNGMEIPADPPEGIRQTLPPDLGLPGSTLAVSYVANLREDKAHLCLVDAAKTVVAAFPDVRFLLVGREDREAASIRMRIRALGLERHIVVTGARTDVRAILRATRVVAHPGEQEGLSNAILEAMGEGVPVVASRAGGNPETVSDGETGLLVPPGDSDALASAIVGLLRDPDRAEAMGRAGKERAREFFSPAAMVTAVEETYLDLLKGRTPHHRV